VGIGGRVLLRLPPTPVQPTVLVNMEVHDNKTKLPIQFMLSNNWILQFSITHFYLMMDFVVAVDYCRYLIGGRA